jgi:hypothetical protein
MRTKGYRLITVTIPNVKKAISKSVIKDMPCIPQLDMEQENALGGEGGGVKDLHRT